MCNKAYFINCVCLGKNTTAKHKQFCKSNLKIHNNHELTILTQNIQGEINLLRSENPAKETVM